MKIAFICNQNQARSQALEAVFARILKNHQFQSFGLIAQESTPLPLVIDSVFADWGLDPSGRFARNMGTHHAEILKLDLVFAMTTLIADEVSGLGFKGQIIDLSLESVEFDIHLIDPQLMPRRQCAFELAKYLKVAYSSLEKLGYLEKSKLITAMIPERESSIRATIERAMSSRNDGSTIVYADLVAPRNDLFAAHLGLANKYRFNPSSVSLDHRDSESSAQILLPAHSATWPSKVYLSQAWAEFLKELISEEIILITPPMKNRSGTVAESYLAALRAAEIQIVS